MPLVYAHPDGNLRKFGTNASVGTWTGVTDTFVHRTTEASSANTGGALGFTRDYANRGLASHYYRPLDPVADAYNGNMTTTANQVVTDKIIYGWVDAHNTSIFRNCIIVGNATPPVSARNLVKVLDHTPTVDGPRALFDCVTIEPQTKSAYWTACLGPYGWEAHRVKAQGTTDILAARSNSAGNGLANVRAYDSWFGPVAQWDPDPITDRTGQPYTGTHNDTIQFEGNTGGIEDIVFDGCTLVGRLMLGVGQPSSDPAFWSEPTSMAAMTAQTNTKDRFAFAFRHTRFYGGAPNCVNLGVGNANCAVEFTNCGFEATNPQKYPQRQLVLDPLLTRTVSGNYELGTGNPVSVTGG